MVRLYFVLFLFFSLIICGCDPPDDRLRILNNSERNIQVVMGFENEIEGKNNFHLNFKVNEVEDSELYTFNYAIMPAWEERFEVNFPDSTISVYVRYENDIPIPSIGFIEPNHLFFKTSGKLYIKEYTLNDIIVQDWVVTFPDDGFKIINP